MSVHAPQAGARHAVQIGETQFTVGDLGAADRDSLCALHEQVFGPGAGDAWYRWKYMPGGNGGGEGSGVWQDGVLIAHCGGIPRRLWRQGRPVAGTQIGDVMVAPQWRGILTRRGPFFHASQAFYSGHISGQSEDRIAFGFPSERHLRLAVTLKLLWDGGPIHSLSWNLSSPPLPLSRWAWRWTALDPSQAGFDPSIDAAWEMMKKQSTALTLGQRDAAYARWRYCERPARRSRFFELRRPWSARATGIAVMDLDGPNALWLDWIGHPGAMPVAASACRAEAARGGAAWLTAWASPAVTQSLQDSGASTAVTAWLGIPRASSLAEAELPGMNWWLMGGDTDFL
ncbi:MAG: GNAT family N-acetyltransferase [Burkholderiales bacterium]|nr:GNAT family N-acetyltransferase [Burkholderiales bacterium]